MSPVDLILWTLAGCAVVAAVAITLAIVVGVARSLLPNRRKRTRSTEIMRGGYDG